MAITPDEEVTLPRCPHCSAYMPTVGLFHWYVGSWLIISTYCAECKKVLHMQVVPLDVAVPRVQIPS